MSYRELVQELNLNNQVIATTKVKYADYEPHTYGGCVYKLFPKVMAGETRVISAGGITCKGFGHNTGLVPGRPNIPGGFGLFLSKGSDQRWTPDGERFKCDIATAEAMFDNHPEVEMGECDAFKFEPYEEGLDCDIVTVFANPDQLSALIVLHGYNRGEYDHVIATSLSGCASMIKIPLAEAAKDAPRAVITSTDIAQREYVEADKIAISFVRRDWDYMLSVTDECFFHSPVFKKTRQRLHPELKPEVNYSTIR